VIVFADAFTRFEDPGWGAVDGSTSWRCSSVSSFNVDDDVGYVEPTDDGMHTCEALIDDASLELRDVAVSMTVTLVDLSRPSGLLLRVRDASFPEALVLHVTFTDASTTVALEAPWQVIRDSETVEALDGGNAFSIELVAVGAAVEALVFDENDQLVTALEAELSGELANQSGAVVLAVVSGVDDSYEIDEFEIRSFE
jgi:hypothetical protein